MTESKKKIDLPFKIINAEVSGGFIDSVHTALTSGIDIVNYHEDKYETLENKPLQSPFTQQWVGGKRHRHVPLNDGTDDATTRQEAWHLEFTGSGVRFYSNAKLGSPPAYWSRDGLAKKPLNIANVKTSDIYVGNYSKNYEVLQGSGRRTLNNLIVDGLTASSDLTTQFIYGIPEYSLPDLTGENSKTIIVERFNSPGSKEESSRGSLDREGEEYSPNITLPFRNLKIRQPFYSQLSQSTPQFGGTIHGVNRNTLIRAGNTQTDNWFVQHAIPRTDIQYSWISASSPVSASELGGYQSFNGDYNRQEAYTDILFNSGSLVVSGSSQDYFVDNFGINSLSKDSKNIDIDTKTFSMSGSVSSSFSEYTNSPYTFTTWTSLRTSEHPVAKQLRKQNIISLQKTSQERAFFNLEGELVVVKSRRGQESLNFVDPPVTYKYKPLVHLLSLENSPNANTGYKLEYTHTNNLSTFANKGLITKLDLKEDKQQFYNTIYSFYSDPTSQEVNPVKSLLGYEYREAIWPREENTGLNITRKRSQYILDQPGFTRDGYDIQLGTQRVFWRDSSQNRKRSNNSEGGYYSSLNYLSTEETGSNFTQDQTSVLYENKFVTFSSSFVTSSGMDSGVFNSIALFENSSSVKEIFEYSSSIGNTSETIDGLEISVKYGDIKKLAYSFDVSGEFNNLYIDFYEQRKNVEEENKKSIGSMYRTTSYKSLLTALPEKYDLYEDFSIQTEDDEFFVNPKLKYVAFVGGVELNTSSYIQNEENFTNDYLSYEGFNGSVSDVYVDGDEVYFVGNFTKAGNIEANRIAKLNTQTKEWQTLSGNFNNTINTVIIYQQEVYVGGNFTSPHNYVAKWNGTSWQPLSGGLNNFVFSLVLSGTDIYAGGAFTTTGSRVAKWDTVTDTWSALSGGLGGTVRSLTVSGSDIYAGGSFTTTGSNIAKWDTVANTWSTLSGGLDDIVYSLVLSGSDIYAGGSFSVTGSKIAKWDTITSTWSALSGGLNGTVFDLAISGSDIYAAGSFSITGSRAAKWDTITNTWSVLSGGLGVDTAAVAVSGSDIYYGGSFTVTGSRAAIWNTISNNWEKVRDQKNYETFSKDYFSQSFDSSSFIYSTIDNGLLRKTENISGKKPFFDSYEDFAEEVRSLAKEYSVIPEFRISEHMKYYVSQNSKNFRTKNNSLFGIDGVGQQYKSSDSETANYNESFLKTYSTTDILKKGDNIKSDNESFAKLDEINLKISGIKKLLPYNGFYPQDRTTQIANLYSEYADSNLHGGIYNLSYYNDYYFDLVLDPNIPNDLPSLDVATLNSEINYLAVSSPNYPSTIFNYGRIQIFTSSVDDPTNWGSSAVAQFTSSYGFNSALGKHAKIISSSNGLNLFTNVIISSSGHILHSTSSDGVNWTTLSKLEVYGSSPSIYVSGTSGSLMNFDNFDLFFDSSGDNEKIIMVLGSHFSTGDSIHTVTGSFISGSWQWSDKTAHFSNVTGSSKEYGSSVSIMSCSSGYQAYFNARKDDDLLVDENSIYVMTSSVGSSWSSPIYIGGAEKEGVASYTTRTVCLKAFNFNDKSYVFFFNPFTDINGYSNNGGVYVISSSASNNWGTSNFVSQKTLLYYNEIANDNMGEAGLQYESGHNNISLFSGSDGRLYYCFGNPFNNVGNAQDQVLLGYTNDGETWQTADNNNVLSIPQEKRGAINSVTVLPYFVGEYELPIFLMNLKDSVFLNGIYALKNNIFTKFTLRLEEAEKYYKHAALEPFFAPGILYNTIKSGIAVDWPCATGSNTAIVPHGGSSIVNAYYPKNVEMYGYSGSNIYESAHGILRSNIDYRIPFENLLFPNEAFKNKDYRATDLISRTVLSTLPDNDPIVQFISETYIYGGYEPYISPIDFSDINNFGPKRFSVPFVYRKNGSTDTGLYTLAMSNFLAETVKFFLKDEKLVTFTSSPDNKWLQFDSNKTYYMDVVLEKSPNLVMMEAYHSDLHPTGSDGQKMNGRYFGYPVNKTDKALWGGAEFTEEESKLIHNDPAYAPYTPPYFEGEARVRIAFKPTGTSRSYTVQEIFDEATIENVFVDVAKGATTGSDAYVNKMPIGSSVELFGSTQAVEVTIDENTGNKTIRELPDVQNWIISPRMETPVLDFSDQPLTSYENNYSKTSGFGRGMWSGYGSVPASGSGVKLRLEYPFTTLRSPLTASLLEQVGFKAEEKNVGAIADKKEISEAIVVVPYLQQYVEEYCVSKNDTGFNFIKISEPILNRQLQNIRQGLPAVPANSQEGVTEDIRETSISQMTEKMRNYVIPPEMNFVQYRDIQPFVMYFFEFKHMLTQQDLADIWQGLMPSISLNAEKDEINISHKSGPFEFFEGKEIPDNLRWLVFKVKKKAEINYFNVTATTTDDQRFNFNKIIGREVGTDVYSYNWPYDFFSLVEFAKIELNLKYKAKENK
jgi:hypothetical protein